MGLGWSGAQAEAREGLGENWLCPDSHASSQPHSGAQPRIRGPESAGEKDEGLAGSRATVRPGTARDSPGCRQSPRGTHIRQWKGLGLGGRRPGPQPLPRRVLCVTTRKAHSLSEPPLCKLTEAGSALCWDGLRKEVW